MEEKPTADVDKVTNTQGLVNRMDLVGLTSQSAKVQSSRKLFLEVAVICVTIQKGLPCPLRPRPENDVENACLPILLPCAKPHWMDPVLKTATSFTHCFQIFFFYGYTFVSSESFFLVLLICSLFSSRLIMVVT